MKTVFLVSTGEYSDYSVVGVFTTELKAQEFMNGKPVHVFSSYNDIKEIPLDQEISSELLGKSLISVFMRKDGKVITFMQTHDDEMEQLKIYKSTRFNDDDEDREECECMVIDVLSRTEQEAIKIANEKRSQLIASGEWDRLLEAK